MITSKELTDYDALQRRKIAEEVRKAMKEGSISARWLSRLAEVNVRVVRRIINGENVYTGNLNRVLYCLKIDQLIMKL